MARSFTYRASLADTTLPEMLATIHRFRVPGILEARHDDAVERVYLRDGFVVHAASTDRGLSLGSYLWRAGRLSREEFGRLRQKRGAGQLRFGSLLVQEGLLSPSEVYKAICEQIESIVWRLFYLNHGEVAFSIGDISRDMVQIQLPLRQVIFEGIKRAPEVRSLLARLGDKQVVFEPSFRIEELIEIGLEAEEFRLLSLVDGRKTLIELCSEGPLAPADNAKLLYAFKTLFLVNEAEGKAAQDDGRVMLRMRSSGDAVA